MITPEPLTKSKCTHFILENRYSEFNEYQTMLLILCACTELVSVSSAYFAVKNNGAEQLQGFIKKGKGKLRNDPVRLDNIGQFFC